MAVYNWSQSYRQGGIDALKSKKASGRTSKLNNNQKEKLRTMIVGADPRQYGFDFGLWTRKIVCELILKEFEITIGVTTAGRLLEELKLTPRKPLERAYQQNPELVSEWKNKIYPKIKKKALKTGAKIHFLDEAGFNSNASYGRTWGPKGEKTVVIRKLIRKRINAVSIVNEQGAFWYETYTGKFNSDLFLEFLIKFLKYRKKKVFLILDNLSIHKSKKVKHFLEENQHRIEFYFLPPYAPELNPDEYVWNYVKSNGVSKRPLKEDETIAERVISDLEKVKKNVKLVKSFFKAKYLNYLMN
jgi:transposase